MMSIVLAAGRLTAAALVLIPITFWAVPVNTSTLRVGIAKHYYPGVMARVAHNRGMRMLRWVDGYASTWNCSRIGQVIWASINGNEWESYQVLDCSDPTVRWQSYCHCYESDAQRHRRTGLVIEVDAASALRNGFYMNGKAPAVVWVPPLPARGE